MSTTSIQRLESGLYRVRVEGTEIGLAAAALTETGHESVFSGTAGPMDEQGIAQVAKAMRRMVAELDGHDSGKHVRAMVFPRNPAVDRHFDVSTKSGRAGLLAALSVTGPRSVRFATGLDSGVNVVSVFQPQADGTTSVSINVPGGNAVPLSLLRLLARPTDTRVTRADGSRAAARLTNSLRRSAGRMRRAAAAELGG